MTDNITRHIVWGGRSGIGARHRAAVQLAMQTMTFARAGELLGFEPGLFSLLEKGLIGETVILDRFNSQWDRVASDFSPKAVEVHAALMILLDAVDARKSPRTPESL